MKNRLNVSSLEKAMMVLKYLAKEPYQFTALELSKALQINRSTVHRILADLMKSMLVLQSPSTKKYKLGPMSYHIGAAYLHASNYSDEIAQIVDEAAKKLELSVGYAVIDDGNIITLYENEHYFGMSMGYKPGTLYPINCGAYGKTLMAFYEPYQELEKIVYTTKLEKRTENTITDPKVLLQEYAHIRERGYAISDGENIKGAFGVGVPVRNSKNKVCACIGVACIKASITPEKLEFIKKVILDAANKISKLIP
ncbi:IclR family transcriptional regulator [Clostridiaceae bacterium 35-E11]